MLAAPKVWAARRSAMKTRADTEQMPVGSGHDGEWVYCTYRRFGSGLIGGEWRSGNYQFWNSSGFYNTPCAIYHRFPRRGQSFLHGVDTIVLIRPAPLKQNELREIDLFPEFKNLQR